MLRFHKGVRLLEVTLGGLSQLLVIVIVLISALLFVLEGRMTIEMWYTLMGGILAGMGIGYINGKKA